MRAKLLGCVMALLIAFSLVGCFAPVALAYADGDAIAIRITPPSGQATESADVEILVADNMGVGFQTVEVRNGEAQAWRDMTGDLDKRESGYYGVTEIRENCTVYVRVAGNDGKTYEKSRYIDCFASAGAAVSTPAASASTDPASTPDTKPRAGTALTPDGQGTVMDNVTSDNGKEFFTITTPSENVFYLVIDKERDSENVYFLNAVTESDLMALAEKDGSAASMSGTGVSAIPAPEPERVTEQPSGDTPAVVEPQPVEQPKTGNSSLIVILIAALAVGGAGWYIKIYKPKKDLANAEDLDELTEAEEETINEDDTPQRPAANRYEPEEPEYPDYESYQGNYRSDEPEEPEDY